MEAGKLRHKLSIQAVTEVEGTIGNAQTVTYATATSVWGEIRPLTGREFVNAQAVDSSATHEIIIRYYSGLTTRHRFLFGSRVFNVVQIRDIAEKTRMMIVLVQEDV